MFSTDALELFGCDRDSYFSGTAKHVADLPVGTLGLESLHVARPAIEHDVLECWQLAHIEPVSHRVQAGLPHFLLGSSRGPRACCCLEVNNCVRILAPEI